MRRLALLCGAMLLFAAVASAQDNPKAEVFGGYSYLRVNPGSGVPGQNFNGGSGSVSFNPNSWLGIVADVGVYHASIEGTGFNVVSYTFGPKLAYRKNEKVTPFAQVLLGGAHISASGESENGFAMALGGGFDWNATTHVGVRVVQAEYVMTRFSSDTQNNARISAGVVFRW